MNRQDAKAAESLRVEPNTELDDLAHRVIGAAIEVHRLLGPGFLESVYEEALCVELTLRGIRFARQLPIIVKYKGEQVDEARLDLLVDERLVVELKAVEGVAPIRVAGGPVLLESDAPLPWSADHLQCHPTSAWYQAHRLYPLKLGVLGVLAVRPLPKRFIYSWTPP